LILNEIEKEEEKLNISRKPSIASGVETTDEITNEISIVRSCGAPRLKYVLKMLWSRDSVMILPM
jgi:hypothetical protein